MGDQFGRRVAATTVALVVVGTATLLAVRSFGPARTSRPRLSEQAPDAADPWEGLRAGWTELPPPPEIREGATLVWTGRGLIAWGGTAPRDDSYAPTADGYAFDPTSRTWSAIPAGPVARIDASAVWTGTEVLIWGGTQKELRVDGAAFDPSTDSWRPTPAAPIEPRYPAAVVWTGRE
ncbi:MAG: hypothetical protein M3P43_02480, partial [Actinomycetota bacterium]|nr:hypothetical protein [Actinomycetota bacterium]